MRQHAENLCCQRFLRVIAQRREIGNQTDVPEHQRKW